MWFPLCLPGEFWGFHAVSLMFTLGNPDFPVVSLMFPFGNLGFPCSFHLSSIWGNHLLTRVSMRWKHVNRSVGCFHSRETTWKKVVSRMETPWKFVVNLWFPCGFPYVSPEGKLPFSPSASISNLHGIKHPWAKGIQVCSNEGTRPLLRGDNFEKLKYIVEIFFSIILLYMFMNNIYSKSTVREHV